MVAFVFAILLLLCSTNSLAQESGWVDSLGYKQQIMKTGAVQQVRFTTTGDSIISITKDSTWHLYVWDTHIGTVRSIYNFIPQNGRRIISVWLAEDSRSYSLTTQNGDSVFIGIYSADNHSLLSNTFVKLKDVTWSIAYYSLQTNTMWVVCNTYSPGIQWDGPTGITGGTLYQFQRTGNTWSTIKKYDGASYYVSVTKGCTKLSRMAHFRDLNYDKGQIIKDFHWLSAELISDTILYKNFYADELNPFEREKIEEYLRRKVYVSSDGNNLFNIHGQRLSHYALPNNNYTTDLTLPEYPSYIKPLATNNHVLLSRKTNLYIYHTGLNKITQTIKLPYSFTESDYNAVYESFVFGSNNGTLFFIKDSIYAEIPGTDFRTSRTIMYPDTTITFFPITKKGAIRFHWDFGDGTISQEQYANHIYKKTGSYNIIVRVLYDSGKEDTIRKNNHIIIEPHLIPTFSVNTVFGSPPLKVQCTDESEGNVTKWLWDFGDGTKDTVQNPTHIYKGQGTYYISLTVTDKIRSKTTLVSTLITTTPYTLDTIYIANKENDNRTNFSYGSSGYDNFSNKYLKGVFEKSSSRLMFYRQECKTNHYKLRHVDEYTSYECITFTTRDHYITYEQSKCELRDINEYSLFNYRNKFAITSFISWSSTQTSGAGGVYQSDGKNLDREQYFAPDGWTYNFDGTFFPDETDVFLFRKKGDSASLQFFANRDSLVKRIRIKAQFSRIFSSNDSSTLILVSNPSFSISDSTRFFTITYFDLKGNIIKHSTVEKKTDCSISDIYSLGNNEFLLCGYTAIKDSLGKITNQKGYIVQLNADGWILWEHTFPTWKSIRKIEKHPNGYFAGLGLPFEKKKHGFITFRRDGKLLSDYRLFQATDSFYAYDFVIGNNENDIWFIGSENVSGQGERGTVYTCNNPVTPTTDINEQEISYSDNKDFSIYPNPANTAITIKNYAGEVLIINNIGSIVHRGTDSITDIQHLPNGVYFVMAGNIPDGVKILTIVR